MFKAALSCLFILGSSPVFAGPCTGDEYDKGEYFARQIGQVLAARDQGESNISTRVFDCQYNGYSDEFILQIGVNWSGTFTGDSYSKEGQVVINDAAPGNTWEFSETYANQNLKDWRIWRGVIAATVVIGASLSE